MKKSVILFALFSILLLPSQAQENSRTVSAERFTVKANPLSILLGTGTVFFEGRLNPNASAQLGVSYFSWTIDGDGLSGLTITPEFRFYIKANALDGPYLAPYIRIKRWEATDDNRTVGTYNTLGAGFVFGRQWVTNSGFDFDFFLGFQMTKSRLAVKGDPGTENPGSARYMDGFWPRIGMALGYAF